MNVYVSRKLETKHRALRLRPGDGSRLRPGEEPHSTLSPTCPPSRAPRAPPWALTGRAGRAAALTQAARLGAAPQPVREALPDVGPHERVPRVAREYGGGPVRRQRPDLVPVRGAGQASARDDWKRRDHEAVTVPGPR